MLSKADMRSYRRQLLDLKKRLGGDMSDLEERALRGAGGQANGNLSNLPLHPADLGTDTFEEELNLALLENQDQILDEVNDALESIDEGTFGRCENCGQEIPAGRLQALPYARYCVGCARLLQGAT